MLKCISLRWLPKSPLLKINFIGLPKKENCPTLSSVENIIKQPAKILDPSLGYLLTSGLEKDTWHVWASAECNEKGDMLRTLVSSRSGCLRVSGWPLTNRSLPPVCGFLCLLIRIKFLLRRDFLRYFLFEGRIAGSQGWLVRSKSLDRWGTHSISGELVANIHNTFPSRKPDQTM